MQDSGSCKGLQEIVRRSYPYRRRNHNRKRDKERVLEKIVFKANSPSQELDHVLICCTNGTYGRGTRVDYNMSKNAIDSSKDPSSGLEDAGLCKTKLCCANSAFIGTFGDGASGEQWQPLFLFWRVLETYIKGGIRGENHFCSRQQRDTAL